MAITASTMLGAPVHTRPATGKGALVGYLAELRLEAGKGQLARIGLRRHRYWGKVRWYDVHNLTAVRGRLYLHDHVSVDTIDSELLELEKAQVYTVSGVFLGVVEDVYFDKTTFLLTQVEVVHRLLFFPYLKLLIGREDIVDMRPKQVIVRDAVLREADLGALLLRKTATLITPQAQQSRRR